jgi:cyclic pyranopterin phosphate synthase
VGAKEVTQRTALATGRVLVSAEVIGLLRGDGVPKGDALGVARIAGIMGAKRTPDLVPLCHPIAISGVTVDLEVLDDAVTIAATVRTTDRTGVEMEALTAVSVAALALIDMVKAVDPAAVVTDVRVESKTGGIATMPDSTAVPGGARAVVVTVSDRSSAGERPDLSGPLAAELLARLGFAVDAVVVVPDEVDEVTRALQQAISAGADLVVTTGGTGLAPRDVTPEATLPVLDREVPGIAEAIRARSREAVPTSALSRGLAGVSGRTLVVNLPGSQGGVRDGIAVLAGIVGHAIAQLRGAGDHPFAG